MGGRLADPADRTLDLVLVVTSDGLPGYEICDVLGPVIAVAATTHNKFVEGLKRLDGSAGAGEQALLARRHALLDQLRREAARMGADAVVAMRFDHREITSAVAEICAYGTAVAVRGGSPRRASPARPAGSAPVRVRPSPAGSATSRHPSPGR